MLSVPTHPRRPPHDLKRIAVEVDGDRLKLAPFSLSLTANRIADDVNEVPTHVSRAGLDPIDRV